MSLKRKIRYMLLVVLLLTTWATQLVPGMGAVYSRHVYPVIAHILSSFSDVVPFAVGDLFIALSIAGMIVYPLVARARLNRTWRHILLRDVEYLLWIYVWFYMAWGLNYSQPNFYERTDTKPVAYTTDSFCRFVYPYIQRLNASYTDITYIDEPSVKRECVTGYNILADTLGIHRPFNPYPRVKTMLFTPLSSKVGVTGSMGPFFCEFTLNGDLLPSQYPATYAHELAHRLGIAREAEANFYAYQICTRSEVREVRFSGYFSILPHVLSNARRLMDEEQYLSLRNLIRPEIIELLKTNQQYWAEKYSPFIGRIQNFVYDLYLKGNKIPSGRKNYSEVVGLLIAWNENTNR
ncbi:MAG: DUF3810 domain-containing protein [Bacteroides sp.]|nr:DUF3810 domain-containing protein [Bacteroides sp.]